MARPRILSDELVRELVAVGQVDILVGVPTFNHAATIAEVVRTIHVGLARHFPRERTVLISPDGGSDDGTPELVRTAPLADAERAGSATLRTTHRVSAPYRGLPDRADGVRSVFAAADLLQAKAVVLVDPNHTALAPDAVAQLAQPVWKGDAELALPVHPRGRYEGALLGQVVRPLVCTAYARRLATNLGTDFACSGRFATSLVHHPMWDGDPARPGFDLWLTTTALEQDLRLTQVRQPAPGHGPRTYRPSLPELFGQVVGAAFDSLGRHAATWTARTEPLDLPVTGAASEPDDAAPPVAPQPLVERFRAGARDLEPLLREILAPATLARLTEAAASDREVPLVGDHTWASVVFEFAAAAHREVMNREHLTQAMVPLYLGRIASYFEEIASLDAAALHERAAALEREFESQRPWLLERWNPESGR